MGVALSSCTFTTTNLSFFFCAEAKVSYVVRSLIKKDIPEIAATAKISSTMWIFFIYTLNADAKVEQFEASCHISVCKFFSSYIFHKTIRGQNRADFATNGK